MQERVFPISRELFEKEILPIIIKETTGEGGRAPKKSHYICFCAMQARCKAVQCLGGIVRENMGIGIQIYTRFKRWSENGLFWTILNE